MAIIIDRTITIKDDKATLDRPLYLYIGDGDITCLFTIEEKKKAATFGAINKTNTITENASYGEVRIYKPDKGSDGTSRLVFTDRAEIIDDKLQVIFSYKNIDDFSEAGIHKLQIHLYDDDDSARNRFTIPPIDINVLLPVGYDNNAIDEAIVGYSLLDTRGIEELTFDEEGNYNKTVWEKGDIITKNKLNKIEDALYEINAADSNFITNEALEAELDNIDAALNGKANMGHTHKEYATKTELNGKAPANHSHNGYASSNHTHSNYATRDELSNKSNIGHGHSEYALKADVPTVPTRLGQLANDKGYITSAEIPSNYVTESELNSYNYMTENKADGKYATTSYVINAINEAQLSGGGGDGSGINLSAYALKSDVPTSTSQLYNNSGFITDDTLNSKGYATTTYVNDTIDERLENVDIDLSNYPTNDDMNSALADKANVEHEHPQYSTTDHTHENYALKSEIPEMVVIPTDVSAFTNDAGYITEEAITPINEEIDNINDSINELDQNLNDYALKTQIPTVPNNVSAFTNDANYISSTSVIRIEVVTELPVPEAPGVLYIVKE